MYEVFGIFDILDVFDFEFLSWELVIEYCVGKWLMM